MLGMTEILRDGAEGISLDNGRAEEFHPILNERTVPYFIGKDVRDLETHLWELYRFRSNYKMQGLAFWSAQAWVEFAILDMLGRITGKSIAQLFGDIIRREVLSRPPDSTTLAPHRAAPLPPIIPERPACQC
jgi:L-alanine-DL-glutamate epimerase-like enolase superfamily enzyme